MSRFIVVSICRAYADPVTFCMQMVCISGVSCDVKFPLLMVLQRFTWTRNGPRQSPGTCKKADVSMASFCVLWWAESVCRSAPSSPYIVSYVSSSHLHCDFSSRYAKRLNRGNQAEEASEAAALSSQSSPLISHLRPHRSALLLALAVASWVSNAY
jgi:hypothetical protein